ncbi:hypothetical protein [Mangrovibacterium lignilyticum]|uniref:hypothetical protein n=1 Tax=Mangrovibacterium lignilyticum TaxID=2668052 RepID=UPI0013D71C71|nr:hypothetical protein [Mangrovibacterium lignilyticum]
MKKIINYLVLLGVVLSMSMAFNACKDDIDGGDEVFIFQPINLTYSLDQDKFSSTYNMGTYTWEDRDETPATHYLVTTYKGLIEEGGTPISTVKEVTHIEGVDDYSVLVDEELLSGTIYEVEIMPYMNETQGHAATITFESVIDDIVGSNTKVATTATTATFKWKPIGAGVAKKIVVTPNEDDLNPNAEETAVVVEMEIPSSSTSITVEGLVSFTGYTAELIDKDGGVVGRYTLKTSMSGGAIVYNSSELAMAIEEFMSSGGAITLSAEQTTDYEYSGPMPTGDIYLMGPESYDGTQASTVTIKLAVEYQEQSGMLNLMRLNIDGNNELENFITFQSANMDVVEQGVPAEATGINIQDCWVVNYTGSAIYSPKEAYQRLESITISNTTFANIYGSLIDFRKWDEEGVNSKFEAGNPYWCSAVKNITIEGSTAYKVATQGGTIEGDVYTRGNSLVRIDAGKNLNNNTLGSTFTLSNTTLIAIADEAPIFLVEDYNYEGKSYAGGIFVQDCLFANISNGSYSTRTGQIANGYNFNPSTNEAADAVSMTTRTSLAQLYGANSNTVNNPLAGPTVSVTFANLNNLDFTITGGSASKGNPALYE